MSLAAVVQLDDLRELARKRLPRIAFDFIEGGCDDERCLQRNRDAFARHRLVPRYLRDVSRIDPSVMLLGRRYASPLGISPMGLAGLFRPGADLMMAAAARDADVPFLLSSASTSSLEQVVAVAPDHVWFQMYATTDAAINDDLVLRATKARVAALVVSVDVPVNANRERNRRNGFTRPLRLSPAVVLEAMGHPLWVWRYLRAGGMPMMGNWRPYAPPGADAPTVASLYGRLTPAPAVSWEHLARIRERWPGPLVVKGLLHPQDAVAAVDIGAQAVVVSNHGGRQLDAAPSPLDMLPSIVKALEGRAEVLFDSGIRRGSEAVIARCMGARSVLFGRPALFGVAAAGQAGAALALNLMCTEIEKVLAQIGCPTWEGLDASWIWSEGPGLTPWG